MNGHRRPVFKQCGDFADSVFRQIEFRRQKLKVGIVHGTLAASRGKAGSENKFSSGFKTFIESMFQPPDYDLSVFRFDGKQMLRHILHCGTFMEFFNAESMLTCDVQRGR